MLLLALLIWLMAGMFVVAAAEAVYIAYAVRDHLRRRKAVRTTDSGSGSGYGES